MKKKLTKLVLRMVFDRRMRRLLAACVFEHFAQAHHIGDRMTLWESKELLGLFADD